MRKFGLIGKNISYSFSQQYFTDKFHKENILDASYQTFDLQDISEITTLFEMKDLVGFNVTIPYKQAILPYLDELSTEAEEIQAVNTVLIKGNKKIGFNTDAFGFEISLAPLLMPHHTKALLLGNGGATKAIAYVLRKRQIEYQIVSRERTTSLLSYEDLNEEVIKQHTLIVNCTPLGTYPNIDNMPNLDCSSLGSNHLVYDLIYNPSKTKLLLQAESQGAKIKNGLEMLEQQAVKAWQIWQKE